MAFDKHVVMAPMLPAMIHPSCMRPGRHRPTRRAPIHAHAHPSDDSLSDIPIRGAAHATRVSTTARGGATCTIISAPIALIASMHPANAVKIVLRIFFPSLVEPLEALLFRDIVDCLNTVLLLAVLYTPDTPYEDYFSSALISSPPRCFPRSRCSSKSWRRKTILLFTPHPDDDTFCCAGTLALLARRQNNIHIFIYTNDDKGSYDPDMTSERLAAIRKNEEEDSCKVLGIPKQNIHWLQFHDGMLEYANPLDLVEQVTKIIRTYRPDVVMTIDPGSEYVRWHKTDHRMAANNTLDAIRASEWHLYFPSQRLHDGLQPWQVPIEAYFYVTQQDANYWVNIDDVLDLKLSAAVAHVSQFDPSVKKYRPDWDPEDLAATKKYLLSRAVKKDGHVVESFRISTQFNQQ